MPLRPFPLPYRIGTDICHVPRVLEILTKPYSEAVRQQRNVPRPIIVQGISLNPLFLRKLFSRLEIKTLADLFSGGKKDINFVARHVAGRWAAKEAIIKASAGRLTFHDIVVFKEKGEAPQAAILDLVTTSKIKRINPAILPTHRNDTISSVDSSPQLTSADPFHATSQTMETNELSDKFSTLSHSSALEDDTAGYDFSEYEDRNISKPNITRMAAGGSTFDHLHNLNGQHVRISISHEKEYAVAVAMVPDSGEVLDAQGP